MSTTEVTIDINSFGEMGDEDYERLKQDIAARGVLVPIEYDSEGRLLDGHNRLRVCDELGIEPPKVVRTFASDRDRLLHIIALNALRRHLSPKRKQHWIHEFEQLTLNITVPIVPKAKPSHWDPSKAAVHAAERQRFHRLQEKIRPAQPVGPDSDPWQLASAILDALEALRPHVAENHAGEIDAIAETVRQLVWGPA